MCNFGLFLSKFGCHSNSLASLEILNSIVEFVDPENLTIHTEIVSTPCTEMKLCLMATKSTAGIGNFLDFCEK